MSDPEPPEQPDPECVIDANHLRLEISDLPVLETSEAVESEVTNLLDAFKPEF